MGASMRPRPSILICNSIAAIDTTEVLMQKGILMKKKLD